MKYRRNAPGRKKIKKALVIIGAILLLSVVVFCAAVLILSYGVEEQALIRPDYEKVDISQVWMQDTLSGDDYQLLYYQTGLGRSAIDELREKGTLHPRNIEKYQDAFFGEYEYACEQIGIITHEERLRDENGEVLRAIPLADIRDGDIFITKATHSLGWRHGHAAIVVNAAEDTTLEAILWGYNSELQSTSKWQSYPSFIHLRLKSELFNSEEERDQVAAEIADSALDTLNDIPYGLLTGIPVKAPDSVSKTQCAHIIWYPYYKYGYDLDSDGFWLVTPNDIANSELLEVVQIFGVGPDDLWP